LDPKSPEAQAFNQKGQNSYGGSTSPSPSPSGSDSFREIFDFGYYCFTLRFKFNGVVLKFSFIYDVLFCYSAEGSSENSRNQGTDETVTVKNGASYKGKRLLQRFVAAAVAGLVIFLF